ncbi:hypothetical protein NOMA109596_04925 [Nocardioides marinus]|jgi:hypothetical protein|uniref:Uncharacterized protein n=1 Tax=Nocardioides marinus TaxID=374514 RepID=A0A7Y9YHF3_9ACTN|nr:hypothetical protein [Nocardioides marinus]MBU2076367.1 hypothetical protein [Actinomycetota bacterium]NYI12306.1 hypothetical protein [Nocardioides marinus]
MADTTPVTATTTDITTAADRLGEQRAALRLRHSQRLTALMEARNDLRGVHALADFVDDSVRWSA